MRRKINADNSKAAKKPRSEATFEFPTSLNTEYDAPLSLAPNSGEMIEPGAPLWEDSEMSVHRDNAMVEQELPLWRNDVIFDEKDMAEPVSLLWGNDDIFDERDMAEPVLPLWRNDDISGKSDMAKPVLPLWRNDGIFDESDMTEPVSPLWRNDGIFDESDIPAEWSPLRLDSVIPEQEPLLGQDSDIPEPRSDISTIAIDDPDIYRQYLRYCLLDRLLNALRTNLMAGSSEQDQRYKKFVACLQEGIGKFSEFTLLRRPLPGRRYKVVSEDRVKSDLKRERTITYIFISILDHKNSHTRPPWIDLLIQKFIENLSEKKSIKFNTFRNFCCDGPISDFNLLDKIEEHFFSLNDLCVYPLIKQDPKTLKDQLKKLKEQCKNFPQVFSTPSEDSLENTFYGYFNKQYSLAVKDTALYRKYLRYSLLKELLKALKQNSLTRTSPEDEKYSRLIISLENALGKFTDFRCGQQQYIYCFPWGKHFNIVWKKERLVAWALISILRYKYEPQREPWLGCFMDHFIETLSTPNPGLEHNTFASFCSSVVEPGWLSRALCPLLELAEYPDITIEHYEELKPAELEAERENYREMFGIGAGGEETFFQCFRRIYFSKDIAETQTADFTEMSDSVSPKSSASSEVLSELQCSSIRDFSGGSAPSVTSNSVEAPRPDDIDPLRKNRGTVVSLPLSANRETLAPVTFELEDRLEQNSEITAFTVTPLEAYRKYLNCCLLEELLIALRTDLMAGSSEQDQRYKKFVECLQESIGKFSEFTLPEKPFTGKGPNQVAISKSTKKMLDRERTITYIFIFILQHKRKNIPPRSPWIDLLIQKFLENLSSQEQWDVPNTFTSFCRKGPIWKLNFLRGMGAKFNGSNNLHIYPFIEQDPQALQKKLKGLRAELEAERENYREIFGIGAGEKETFLQCFKRIYLSKDIAETETTDLTEMSDSVSSELSVSSRLTTSEYSFFSRSPQRNTAPTTPPAGDARQEISVFPASQCSQ